MTRSDLVAALADKFGQLTQRDTEFAVKTILDAMSDALARGHRIEIRGFGSFSINRRPPRVGRNPRSGEQVTIPEKLVPHFKPGKALREAVDAERPERGDRPVYYADFVQFMRLKEKAPQAGLREWHTRRPWVNPVALALERVRRQIELARHLSQIAEGFRLQFCYIYHIVLLAGDQRHSRAPYLRENA